MAERRYVALIEGRVQKGGFRSFVKKQALMQGVTGYAENLSTGEVILVMEGEEASLAKLLENIREGAPTYIEIKNMEKRKEKYRGAFNDFERKGSDIVEGLEEEGTRDILLRIASTSKSTDEKMERGIEYLSDIKQDTGEIKAGINDIKQDTGEIKAGINDIKQDTGEIKAGINDIKQDTSAMLTKQDETISVMKEEGEKTRTELSSAIKDEGKKTRREHIKTRELSHEIFYSEVQVLREEIKKLSHTVEKIKEKVGIS